MTDWRVKLFTEVLNIGVGTCWEGKVMSFNFEMEVHSK